MDVFFDQFYSPLRPSPLHKRIMKQVHTFQTQIHRVHLSEFESLEDNIY